MEHETDVRREMSAKPRVLIVEDEMVVALFLEDVLDEFGYRVAGVVTQLDDAMARNVDYDVAVLDVHINGRSVFEFADMLVTRGIPFVCAQNKLVPDTDTLQRLNTGAFSPCSAISAAVSPSRLIRVETCFNCFSSTFLFSNNARCAS